MRMDKLTQKSQEALEQSQRISMEYNSSQVEPEHLLSALITQENGLVPAILGRMEVDLGLMKDRLETELRNMPKVYGAAGVQEGQVYISPKLNVILTHALRESERLKDDYVSVEHLLLAISEDEIMRTKVDYTIIGGKVVYSSGR